MARVEIKLSLAKARNIISYLAPTLIETSCFMERGLLEVSGVTWSVSHKLVGGISNFPIKTDYTLLNSSTRWIFSSDIGRLSSSRLLRPKVEEFGERLGAFLHIWMRETGVAGDNGPGDKSTECSCAILTYGFVITRRNMLDHISQSCRVYKECQANL